MSFGLKLADKRETILKKNLRQMSSAYKPPYSITPAVLKLVAELGEAVGRLSGPVGVPHPRLRRENRIRTIQASLAIENNTLTVEQVTAVIDGRRVLGQPREIQEVRNAFLAYEAMERWNANSQEDLLKAHGVLMATLVDAPGRFRQGGVGVYRGHEVMHMAPPASRVPALMGNLLSWLEATDEHPLVASCVFHYELEFIHPFADGNGRMGRLWQTLILRRWKPFFSYLPVESVIKDRQTEYYRTLSQSDHAGDATAFVEFMLRALLDAIRAASSSDQVGDQVSDQVKALLKVLKSRPMGGAEAMKALGLTHRPTFRKNYIDPALEQGLIERTQPESPRSPTQKYRLSSKG
jgi:Fic family protein